MRCELGVDVGGGRDIAIGEMAEVELHPGLKAPFERHFVDRPGALAAVHRRVVVPRRVEMGAVVRRELHALDRPSLPVRQVLLLEPRKERKNLREALLVVDVFDSRARSPGGPPRRRSAAARKYRPDDGPSFSPQGKSSRALKSRFAARPGWSARRCDQREARSCRRCRESGRSQVRNNCRPSPSRRTRRRGSSRPAMHRR